MCVDGIYLRGRRSCSVSAEINGNSGAVLRHLHKLAASFSGSDGGRFHEQYFSEGGW
jgi:hypothetical protein